MIDQTLPGRSVVVRVNLYTRELKAAIMCGYCTATTTEVSVKDPICGISVFR